MYIHGKWEDDILRKEAKLNYKKSRNYPKKSIKSIIFTILMIIGLLVFIYDVSNYTFDDYTAEDLGNARVNRALGKKLNKEDKIMLEGFDKWQSDQD